MVAPSLTSTSFPAMSTILLEIPDGHCFKHWNMIVGPVLCVTFTLVNSGELVGQSSRH